MMGTKITLTMVCSFVLAVISFAQEPPRDILHRGPDPANALIERRVLAPSGQQANFNVKIILSEAHRPLVTLYTNKHAEFRFPNLREGNISYRLRRGDSAVAARALKAYLEGSPKGEYAEEARLLLKKL